MFVCLWSNSKKPLSLVCGIFDTVFALSEEGQKSVTHNATCTFVACDHPKKKAQAGLKRKGRKQALQNRGMGFQNRYSIPDSNCAFLPVLYGVVKLKLSENSKELELMKESKAGGWIIANCDTLGYQRPPNVVLKQFSIQRNSCKKIFKWLLWD